MEITYLGHSSFRLRSKDASVVTDPFDPKLVGLKFPKVSADIVTISHEHKDHSSSEQVKDVQMVINGPGEYEIKGVSIVGIPTFHDDKKGENRGKNTLYIFEMDKIRIAHLGDLGHKLEEGTVEELGTVDILMIPVGGEYTIGPALATEAIRDIEPSIVLPMHYKIPGMEKSFDKLSSVDEFLKEVGMSVEEMDKLSIKKGDLLEGESKVIVLKPKS